MGRWKLLGLRSPISMVKSSRFLSSAIAAKVKLFERGTKIGVGGAFGSSERESE